jgi:hypothetical protein
MIALQSLPQRGSEFIEDVDRSLDGNPGNHLPEFGATVFAGVVVSYTVDDRRIDGDRSAAAPGTDQFIREPLASGGHRPQTSRYANAPVDLHTR